jgi:hypothetical protein
LVEVSRTGNEIEKAKADVAAMSEASDLERVLAGQSLVDSKGDRDKLIDRLRVIDHELTVLDEAIRLVRGRISVERRKASGAICEKKIAPEYAELTSQAYLSLLAAYQALRARKALTDAFESQGVICRGAFKGADLDELLSFRPANHNDGLHQILRAATQHGLIPAKLVPPELRQ